MRTRGTQRAALVQRLAFTRPHGHLPVDLQSLCFLALFNSLVARVGKDFAFLSVQQLAGLGYIADMACRAHHGVHQPRISIHAYVRLHPEVPLLALLALVHLAVALAAAVLGRAWCRNQAGVYGRAFFEQVVFGGQQLVDSLESMADRANGGRPVLATGACGSMSASNCAQGTTCSISSSNTRLRVRRQLRSMARLVCFMVALLPFAPSHAIGGCTGF